ncbi:MAG: DUF819 family protein [Verrucomicrobia bacterium]|nr:DUF819 family protein [Verrucomicrobiota bacterium]
MPSPCFAAAVITHDAVVLGLLAATLGFIFWGSAQPTGFWRRFYSYVPSLLLCYLLPALYHSFGLIDGHASRLYPVARDYLLPAALVLLTVSVDLSAIRRLGPKALVMFLTGTLGVMLGAVVSFLTLRLVHPSTVAGEVWRGMATLAGSWIGGGANQAALKEVFQADATLFGQFVAVDVLVANLWMAFLLILAGRAKDIDRWTGADTSVIDDLRRRIESYQAEHTRLPGLSDLMLILGIGLGATGLAHFLAGPITGWIRGLPASWRLQDYSLTATFFWVVLVATAAGLLLSATPARKLEGVGASRLGSVMLYFLVATIGMQMDLRGLLDRPFLFALGAIWICTHGALMLLVARLIRAPVFFMAVGSQANIGGAASAPIVASAFHPALAPVGVLLAVLGYALGTYGGYLVGLILQRLAA